MHYVLRYCDNNTLGSFKYYLNRHFKGAEEDERIHNFSSDWYATAQDRTGVWLAAARLWEGNLIKRWCTIYESRYSQTVTPTITGRLNIGLTCSSSSVLLFPKGRRNNIFYYKFSPTRAKRNFIIKCARRDHFLLLSLCSSRNCLASSHTLLCHSLLIIVIFKLNRKK